MERQLTEDQDLAVSRYSWYILNALRYKVQSLEKGIQDAEESIRRSEASNEDSTDVHRSLRNLVEFAHQARKEYGDALEALQKVGLR